MTNRFFFVVPMFNASYTLQRMLHSVLGQSYEHWHIELIDDCSDAAEQASCVTNALEPMSRLLKPGQSIDVTWNSDGRGKRWETDNVLYGISRAKDDDIICRLDADDFLCDLDGLTMIEAAYQTTGCDVLWTAHRWGFSDKNISGPMPDGVDPYRDYPWVSSHLKTFRKSLLNEIPYENFTNMNGDLVKRAGDQALYLPCLYRAKKRIFLPRCIYHYTIDEQNGTVYQTEDAKFQKEEADYIRVRGYVLAGTPWEQHDMFVSSS